MLINGKTYTELAYTITDTDAVFSLNGEGVTFDALESDLVAAEGAFVIEDHSFSGFVNIVAIQKLYRAEIGDVNSVYEVILRSKDTVDEVIAGRKLNLEEAFELRNDIETMATMVPDDKAKDHTWAFPLWSGAGIAYSATDPISRVKYDSLLYKCIQSHTSQPDWDPIHAVSLWARMDDPAEEWPEWRQPTGAHDAYAKGSKVSHNDKHWISNADSNVWEPGVYGWDESTD